MITQLNPPLPLQTPKGKAWAVAIIDYGPDWDLCWITFVADSGECWTFQNQDIRQEPNMTFGHIANMPGHIAPRMNGNKESANKFGKNGANYIDAATAKDAVGLA